MLKRTGRFLFLGFLLFISHVSNAYNVGLLIVGTGKYVEFVPPLISSAKKYFCTNHDVTFFVFTDGKIDDDKQIVRIEQKRLGWPHDTLMRLSMYDKHRDKMEKMDYLFACDADMLFENVVGDEILSDRVATQHPGYVGRRGTYESRRTSTAFVNRTEGAYYFAGGFNGGSRKEFLKMASVLTENIKKDLEKNIIAIWHDESHINRYFIDNPPTKILSPSYCYPDNDSHYRRGIWREPYTRRLVAIDKAHAQFQKGL